MINMNQEEIKDTVELVAINSMGIGISLSQINGAIRTLILLGTLIYTIVRIVKVLRESKQAKKNKH